jgi:hypothetical protein
MTKVDHEFGGRKYVYSSYSLRADWYRNIEADPRVMMQTARGAESVIAKSVLDNNEPKAACSFLVRNPVMQQWIM